MQKNTEEITLPKHWETLKEKHPDALIIVSNEQNCRLFNEDAQRASMILELPLREHPESGNGVKASIAFPYEQLDAYMPKLVRAGERVALAHDMSQQAEAVAAEQQQDQKNEVEQEQEQSRGMHR